MGRTRTDESGKSFGRPLIGADVIIYKGASVLGPVVVLAGTVIKASQIISKDEQLAPFEKK